LVEQHLAPFGEPGAGDGKAGEDQQPVQPHLEVGAAEDWEGVGEGGLHAIRGVLDARRDIADADVVCHGRLGS